MCSSGDQNYGKTTYILDTMDFTWRTGGDLPGNGVTDPGFADNGDTFFVVGGRDGGQDYLTWILEWDPNAEAWIERAETINPERAYLGAMFVEDEKVECN